MSSTAVLEVSGLSKVYGDAIALNGASLELQRGEIHAIVGENGAGKSTLVKVLSGMVIPDAGTVSREGVELVFGHPGNSRKAGISTSFQELSLLSNLTVAENLLISELPRQFGVVRRSVVEKKAAAILAEWGVVDIAPDTLVAQLPLSAKQRLEIVRALNARPDILILDEPTAALPDTEWLFHHVRSLRDTGTAVLYISHKLREIAELCDRGTVMRNGAIVGSFEGSDFNHDELISTMIGRSINLAFPPRVSPIPADAPIVLVGEELTVGRRLTDVSLSIRGGEILGVAGLEGQGQRELFYALAGELRLSSGTVTIAGEPADLRSPRTAMRSGPGIALVPEERKREALFPDLPTSVNITVPALSEITRGGIVRHGAEEKLAAEAGAGAHLPDAYLPRIVGQLSGGNQQKAVLARTSLTGAQVLLMFDPTRGIDPSAKLEVYGTLRKAAEAGAAILLYSTEIPELVGLSDRVVVLYGGQIAADLTGDQIQEDAIMSAAVGHARNPGTPNSGVAS